MQHVTGFQLTASRGPSAIAEFLVALIVNILACTMHRWRWTKMEHCCLRSGLL